MESIVKFVDWCRKENLNPSHVDNILLYAKIQKGL